MANPEQKSFHLELIDPKGKLLEGEATSVVLPAHDGQLGILYDHMPMLCQLGLGIMKVTPAPGDKPQEAPPGDRFFFIDGGSALVAQNAVTVIAYDALDLKDIQPEQIQALIDETAKNAGRETLPDMERAHETDRLRALQRLAESRRD